MRYPLVFTRCSLLIAAMSLILLTGCPDPPDPPDPNAPTASFTAIPSTGQAPLTVQFTDTSTAPEGYPITHWWWDLGDGTRSSDPNPSHKYTVIGSYDIKLIVTNSAGKDSHLIKGGVVVTAVPPVDPNPGTRKTFAGIEFVWVPKGSFQMGCPLTENQTAHQYGGDAEDYECEHPQHKVTFAKGFWMSRFEITQAQWLARFTSNPSYFLGNDRPVDTVSWNDCLAYLSKLNALGAGTFRLPTEAEWEYACRAGQETEFSFGDDVADFPAYGWCEDNSNVQTHNVGLKKSNAWGLYDMHGNVIEWCADCAHASYANAPANGTEWTTGCGTNSGKMARGGSYFLEARYARSAMRLYFMPKQTYADLGFRIVRNAD